MLTHLKDFFTTFFDLIGSFYDVWFSPDDDLTLFFVLPLGILLFVGLLSFILFRLVGAHRA